MQGWHVTYHEELPRLKKPVLIEGLPGIGNVGKIAVDFLIHELKAVKLCSFFSYSLPHSVFVGDDDLVRLPTIELYYKSFGPRSKKPDLLFLCGDIQPTNEESCYSFCDTILSLSREFGVAEIITTGGIGLQQVPDNPRVYATANSKALLRRYTKKGLGVEKHIHGVVGPIIGVSGILLGLGASKKVKGVSLLAETFGHPLFVGVHGAKKLVDVLNKQLHLGVSFKQLNKEIVEMEKEAQDRMKEWLSEVGSNVQAGAKAKSREVHYIG